MSSEKTAEMFKNQSEEQIINWMIKNMTPEQIKSCFDGATIDLPEQPEQPKEEELTVNDLRKFCENKRYVIHKIEGKGKEAKVLFWYYLTKSGKWQYSIEPLSSFPKTMGGEADECGADTLVKDEFRDELRESYNNNELYEGKLFNEYNKDENENDFFNYIKSEYKTKGINDSWVDNLLTAFEIQKSVKIPDDKKAIFEFAPVLIEATTETKVYYYYLKQYKENNELEFVYDNINLVNFENDLKEILDELNFDESISAGRWKTMIQIATNKIDKDDLETIKKNYTEFPLSKDSKYFMKNLFEDTGAGIGGGVFNYSQYVQNKYGSKTAELFTAKVLVNKYGTSTVSLVKK